MAQEIINVGTAPNDGAGDPLRTAFTKTNNNFSQLFATGGVSGIANGTSNISIVNNGSILMSPTGTANVVAVTAAGMTVTGTLKYHSRQLFHWQWITINWCSFFASGFFDHWQHTQQ